MGKRSKCSVKDCDRDHQYRTGYCGAHHRRFIAGDLAKSIRIMNRPKERLLSYIEKDLNDCWIWKGPINRKGYGTVNAKRDGFTLAHRWAYSIYKGSIPAEYTLDHLCRNRPCVNPDHLEAVPHVVNVQRGNRTIKGPICLTHGAQAEYQGRIGRYCKACKAIKWRLKQLELNPNKRFRESRSPWKHLFVERESLWPHPNLKQ